MKSYLLLISTILVSQIALAAVNSELIRSTLEAQPTCDNFVRYDNQNVYLGFGRYKIGMEEPRSPIPGKLRIAPLSGAAPFELSTKDAAIDLVTVNSQVYVLTYSSIEQWDLGSRQRVAEFPTSHFSGVMAYKQHAQAFARYKDQLVIAHGRLGISIFDLKSKTIVGEIALVRSQLPVESMATGITIQGQYAYVAMDSFTLYNPGDKPPFQGIIVIDLESLSVVAELDGMDPGVDSIVSDASKVIVSFGGIPIWKYTRSLLQGEQIPNPDIRIWKFPVPGHPTGAPAMDDKYYYTCFAKRPTPPASVSTNVPMALNRAQLMLE